MQQSAEGRSEPRDEVFHRARLTRSDGRSVAIVVVNLSPHGFMARIDDGAVDGERVELVLPVVDRVGATVRWSLGGRIGGEFERAIDPRQYRALLAAVGG